MRLDQLDRRIVFLFVALALSIPLLLNYSVTPARMQSAEDTFQVVEQVAKEESPFAFVAMDFGPNTKAENETQSSVFIEHLMRQRIPFAVFSLYALAEPFLQNVPEQVAKRLMEENPGETWKYGKDWVNLGYRPGAFLIIQAIPKSENLAELFESDVYGNNLSDLKAFSNIKTLKDISLLGEFTGLTGAFDTYVRFFQQSDYRPRFAHGCTSITIPEAFIYVDSGQLQGLLEGIAGASWYSEMLRRKYPKRAVDDALVINTGLGVAHLIVILLILFGNATLLRRKAK